MIPTAPPSWSRSAAPLQMVPRRAGGPPTPVPAKDDAEAPAHHSQPADDRLALSVEEAGALLGISKDLAYDLVARRELPSVRLGRRIVVTRRALEETAKATPMAWAASRSAASRKWA